MDAAAVKASLDRFKTQTNKADLTNVTSIDVAEPRHGACCTSARPTRRWSSCSPTAPG